MVLSHTPFRELVGQYGDMPVLVAGRGHVLDVARSYGFTKVLSLKQMREAMPEAVPFRFHAGESAGAARAPAQSVLRCVVWRGAVSPPPPHTHTHHPRPLSNPPPRARGARGAGHEGAAPPLVPPATEVRHARGPHPCGAHVLRPLRLGGLVNGWVGGFMGRWAGELWVGGRLERGLCVGGWVFLFPLPPSLHPPPPPPPHPTCPCSTWPPRCLPTCSPPAARPWRQSKRQRGAPPSSLSSPTPTCSGARRLAVHGLSVSRWVAEVRVCLGHHAALAPPRPRPRRRTPPRRSNDWPSPRFGQGAFVTMFEAMVEKVIFFFRFHAASSACRCSFVRECMPHAASLSPPRPMPAAAHRRTAA